MGLLLFYLLLALGVSFLCSTFESGILSISRSQVARLCKDGRTSGKLLEGMKKNIERPLAAILTLNTVAHTVGAAGVGAQAHELYGEASVTITSAILTVLILVFSEIIPKTLGVVYAAKLASVTAYSVQAMIILTYPLVIVFQAMSRIISGGEKQGQLSREEFALLAELGHSEGAIRKKEYRVIRNLLKLNMVTVGDIMTPQSVVFMLPKNLTVAETVENYKPLRFARTPIYGKDEQDFAGVVLRHKINDSFLKGDKTLKLLEIAEPVHVIQENASVGKALNEFIAKRHHLFLVLNTEGKTVGIVTLEDVIETLLGEEIVDETDPVVDMRQLAGRLFDGKLHGRRF